MTRGRLWIGVLGLLLVGIVALNVVTLSFAASLGKLEEQSSALEAENGVLANREATRDAAKRVHRAAGLKQGLVAASLDQSDDDRSPPRRRRCRRRTAGRRGRLRAERRCA